MTDKGKLDKTFGVDGVFSESVFTEQTETYAAVPQSTGKLVTAGYARELATETTDILSLNIASGEQDAPLFAFAGTVYRTAHEPIDCIGSGSEGAQLEITDANGNVFTQLVNAAGTSPTSRRASRSRIRRRCAFRVAGAPCKTRSPLSTATCATPKKATSARPAGSYCPDCERKSTRNTAGRATP